MATATKTRRRRCSECGELKDADEVLGRQRLCEKCEQDKTYCKICDWWSSPYGDDCRHVGWSNECGCNCGCGTEDIEADAHKESFLVLLSKLSKLKTERFDGAGDKVKLIHEPLLPQLLTLIEQNRFWTQWHGPLIGGPPALALRYSVPTSDYCPTLVDIEGHEQERWGRKAIDSMQLGMAWLTSLDKKSKEANALTTQWIREYLGATP